MTDYESRDLAGAAHLAAMDAEPAWPEYEPSADDLARDQREQERWEREQREAGRRG